MKTRAKFNLACATRVIAFVVAIAVTPRFAVAFEAEKPTEARSRDVWTPDAAMLEVIRRVRENEERYGNLETVVRFTSQMAGANARLTRNEQWRTVWQSGLLYFEGRDAHTTDAGEQAIDKHLSAFDGEKTRTVEFGNCVNIHIERAEWPEICPPHSWPLLVHRITFPLSVYLEGTKAVAAHPNVHRTHNQGGTTFDFPRVESFFDGEETVSGLKCARVRVHRWFAQPQADDNFTTHLLWLSPERNYLCIKSQMLRRRAVDNVQPVPDYESTIDEFHEAAPGTWLPAKVTSRQFTTRNSTPDKPVTLSTDTIVLEQAKLKPDYPASFFRDINIPGDLPVFTIKESRFADSSGIEMRQGTPDNYLRLNKVIPNVRENEARYPNIGLTLEFQTIARATRARRSTSTSAGETQYLRNGDKMFASHREREETRDVADNGEQALARTSENASAQVFNGRWSRQFNQSSRTNNGQPSEQSIFAWLRKGKAYEPLVFVAPHILGNTVGMGNLQLSETMVLKVHPMRGRKTQIDWLGEEERNGLMCDVVRIGTLMADDVPYLLEDYRILWLARERNYLPLRGESYSSRSGWRMPWSITTTNEFHEIAPGVWCPSVLESYTFQSGDLADVANGWALPTRKQVIRVKEARINADAPDERFTTLIAPKATNVTVHHESGRTIGTITMPEGAPITITDERFAELRDKANADAMQNEDERFKALDAVLGKDAPLPAAAEWINSEPRTWSDYPNRFILVYFWADWCPDCEADLKRLSRLQKEWAGQDNVAIVVIHAAGAERAAVEKTLKAHGISFPVGIDAPQTEESNGWGKTIATFQISALPHAFVVDKRTRANDHGTLEEMIKRMELLRK